MGMLAFSLHSDADADRQGNGQVCVCVYGGKVGLAENEEYSKKWKMVLRDLGFFDATWEVTTAAMPEYACLVLIRATE